MIRFGVLKPLKKFYIESSAKTFFVILSAAKDLAFAINYQILRSLCSLRMKVKRTFAEVCNIVTKA
jgi:hypothetical protein